MAKVFIAKNEDDKTIDVVLARNEEIAMSYWFGKNIYVHHIISYDQRTLDNLAADVISIVSTEKKMIMNADSTKEQEYYVII